MLRQLPRVTLLGARLNLRARFGKLAQTSSRRASSSGIDHAVGNIRRIRRLGFGHQIGDLSLQLRLDLPACSYDSALCRWRWRGSSCRRAQSFPFQHAISRASTAPERTALRSPSETAAERSDRVVVGMIVSPQ